MAIRYTSSFNETIPFSDVCAQIHLTTDTAETWTVPGTSDQKFVLTFGLPSTANVFVGYNVTATYPSANTVTTTGKIEFITPDMQRYAIGGDVLSLKSPDADAYIGISVRSIPN